MNALWDCRGTPSWIDGHETVVVHLNDGPEHQEVVERFVGFLICNPDVAGLLKNRLERGYTVPGSHFVFNAHEDGLRSNGQQRVIRVVVWQQIKEHAGGVRCRLLGGGGFLEHPLARAITQAWLQGDPS